MTRTGAALLACVVVTVASARIVSTYREFSHTIDEPDHLAAGMQWLALHKYTYEDQHPPLARVMGAIGPYLGGERWNRDLDAYGEGYRMLGFGKHYDRILSLGRLGILPFFLLGSFVVFMWGFRAGGPWSALASTLLFTTLPPVLAHAGLLTTDMAVAAFTGAAALFSLYWVDKPSRSRTIGLGVLIGLAALSKFSSLLFLPTAWLAMYAFHRIPMTWRAAGMLFASAGLMIWAGYNFSFARVEFLHMRLPAARFFSGINSLWRHNSVGHLSYLLGKRSISGFWYYYPVVLAAKTPVALLILTIWSSFFIKHRERFLPLAFSFAILFAASFSRINIGVRHILPVYVGFCVAGGAIATHARWRLLVFILIGWQAVIGVWSHPDYLAYTNEFVGSHPEEWVVDSDLDWGQDMNRLDQKLREVKASEFAFAPFNRTYSTLAGHVLPKVIPLNPDHPLPGWNVVSVTLWKLYGIPNWASHPPKQPERVGRSLLVWHIP